MQAPQWITAVAVPMMVVGFSGLATALSPRGAAPYAENRGPEPKRRLSRLPGRQFQLMSAGVVLSLETPAASP